MGIGFLSFLCVVLSYFYYKEYNKNKFKPEKIEEEDYF